MRKVVSILEVRTATRDGRGTVVGVTSNTDIRGMVVAVQGSGTSHNHGEDMGAMVHILVQGR